MAANIAFIVGAYLFGSFPYMRLLCRAKGYDISNEADLHIALWQKLGRFEALAGIIVDILKGYFPIILGFALDLPLFIVVIAGIGGVIGQMWPVFQRFSGEKGNTTGLGMVLGICVAYAPLLFILGIIPLLIGISIRTYPRFIARGQSLSERLRFGGPASNSLPIGMIVTFTLVPVISWILQFPLEITASTAALLLIVVIRRLTARLSTDLQQPRIKTRAMLRNRLFLDRSYR